MRKTGIVVILIALMLIPNVMAVQAGPNGQDDQPPCGNYDAPSTCMPQWQEGQYVKIKATVPFVWLRHDPSSWAGAVATAYPGQDPSFQVVTAAEQTAYFDGYQWWWHVRVYPDGGAEGWVEQASLEVSNFDPDDDGDVVPPAKANWRVPTNGRVTEGVPFLWLRNAPYSYAGVLATIPGGGYLVIIGNPIYDGVQWWWLVEYGTYSGRMMGYVEQNRIRPA